VTSPELPDNKLERHRFRARIRVAGAAVLVAFSVILARLVFLQLIEHERYQAQAEDNRISVVPIPPDRGMITDRNGIVLARNSPGYALEIAAAVRDVDSLIDDLSKLVAITARDRARFNKLRGEASNAKSLPIRLQLSEVEVAKFVANRYRYLGVADINVRMLRDYPHGDAASHVMGHIARITARDQASLEEAGRHARYRGTEFIGRAGLEASYEDDLHGTSGYEHVEIDAAGRRLRTLERWPAEPGKNLGLTLDSMLQRVTEKAFGDRRGAAVALDPYSGAVLALVSRPGFDPNLFVDGIEPENWSQLNGSPDRPLINRAITGVYPPGSTFKPFMAMAALELGKRTPASTIQDNGYFDFGGRRFRSARPGGYGRVDLLKSIVVSSDVYYYHVANDLGIDAIAAFMAKFGFGSRTGIDLGGEASGVLPSPEWKRARFQRIEQQRWYPGETISVGIGQGYNAYTPLQLATAVATLVSGGLMYTPRLVAYIEDRRTGQRTHVQPKLMRQVELKTEHVQFIKRAMAGVNKEGTAARAFAGAPYTSGGKTGTAQVIGLKQGESYVESKVAERHRDHSWFVAFAPVERPSIALAVIVENGGFGARAAAPIARTMLDYYLVGTLPAGMDNSEALSGEADD